MTSGSSAAVAGIPGGGRVLSQEQVMEAVLDEPVTTHRVGKFEFRLVTDEGDPSPDKVADLRARRTEAITRWLLAQWQREQQRRIAERN